MKKNLVLVISLLLIALLFGACKGNNDKSLDEKTKLETENNTDIEETKEPIDVSQADDAQEVVAESNPWFFSSTDLTGKEIHTKEFFADSKLTLVNVWGTFCGPCKAELPDLGKIAREFADKDVQVLGITSDVFKENQSMVEVAKELLAEANVEYTNLTSNNEVNNKILANVCAIPTTYLVDANGVLIGEPIVGANSYEFFANLIEDGLSEIEK